MRVGVLLLVVLVCAPVVAVGDAVLEAKRKAAADLFREGKTADAVSLIREVIRVEPGGFKDHLLLGRALDKANQAGEAVEAYRKVAELLTGATAEERAARVEVERRLKVLDQQTQKIAAAEEEFLKRLDALEREAIGARDVRAVERVFRLKAGVYRAGGRRDRAGVEVAAGAAWQDSGFTCQAGRTYRIRAVGTSRYKSGITCSPDGADVASANGTAPLGMLMAQLDSKPGVQIKIGSSGRVTAEADGKLKFLLNCVEAEKNGATGGATVLIEAEQ